MSRKPALMALIGAIAGIALVLVLLKVYTVASAPPITGQDIEETEGPVATIPGGGKFVPGADFPLGTYETVGAALDCHAAVWDESAKWSRGYEVHLAEETFSGEFRILFLEPSYEFLTARCGEWVQTRDLQPTDARPTINPNPPEEPSDDPEEPTVDAPDPSDSPEPSQAAVGGFQSPSGNLVCYFLSSATTDVSVGCLAYQRHWEDLPPKPEGCPSHLWGAEIRMEFGEMPRMVCAEESDGPSGWPVLDYGASEDVGPVRCESKESGVTCRDENTDHAFFVSTESYEIS